MVPANGTSDGGVSDGGLGSLLDETQSRSRSPSFTLTRPGTYYVNLAVAGPGGTSSASGQIIVGTGDIGAPCRRSDDQCQNGLRCLCAADKPGRDGACPGSLASGLCTKAATVSPVPPAACVSNLSRSQTALPDGGSGDGFRQPICVMPCSVDTDCRADQVCREATPEQTRRCGFGPASVWQSLFCVHPRGCRCKLHRPLTNNQARATVRPASAKRSVHTICAPCPAARAVHSLPRVRRGMAPSPRPERSALPGPLRCKPSVCRSTARLFAWWWQRRSWLYPGRRTDDHPSLRAASL